jgi:hypothetical protein
LPGKCKALSSVPSTEKKKGKNRKKAKQQQQKKEPAIRKFFICFADYGSSTVWFQVSVPLPYPNDLLQADDSVL